MSQDTLSDVLRTVRLRGAAFYYVSHRDQWAAEAPPAREIAPAVMPGVEHVVAYHMTHLVSPWRRAAGRADAGRARRYGDPVRLHWL